ncbi:MAG TPA: translation initiation factor IF-2 subunit beta [Candidatus Altiarchaeales archaeon]|nr:translation initiation factor IF-2 subunit beta [Candidatus Altiarchaeales archaeon]
MGVLIEKYPFLWVKYLLKSRLKLDYEYGKLLDRAWKALPEDLKSHKRFELPKVDSLIEGKTTIIRNFTEIANSLDRSPQHILTFLSKELAAPAIIEGNRVVIQRNLKNKVLEDKIGDYAREYVLCHECERPDTQLTELEGEKIIKCTACGAWWPLRRIK